MKRILGALRRADEAFDLIRPGDHIFIGVSGGKDSLVLVQALALYRYFSKKPYTLTAGMLGLGLQALDTEPIRAYCAAVDVPFAFRDSDIGPIVFEHRREPNPCSLCARMRRAMLNDWALAQGCNKLALGHHAGDVTETLLMNLLYNGRLGTFSPITHLDRSGITQIRPLVFAKESQIVSAAQRLQAPVLKNPCPASGNTKREEIKQLMATLRQTYPDLEQNLLHAIATPSSYMLWDGPAGTPPPQE